MNNQRGQSTVEYAVVIAVIIAALLAMQIYMKRGTMGKLRDASDQIGEQFDPKTADYTANVNINSQRVENLSANGQLVTNFTNETQNKTWNGNFSNNLNVDLFD